MVNQIKELHAAAELVPDMVLMESHQDTGAALNKILAFWPLIKAALYLARIFSGAKGRRKITSIIMYLDTLQIFYHDKKPLF